MIIEKKKEGEVFIPPQVRQREFTMKVTPEAFSATIDNLYTDTIYSPVREYMANAVDAHLSIGSTDPIEVHIPTSLELWFEVKDYGPGLSEEDIEEYFIKLFSSKKQNTNDQMGFFGLGCKAALTYTNQMTVTSRQNGFFKEYNIMRQGREIPVMLDGRSGPTNERDGLTIRYNVRSRDIDSFYSAVNWASIAFNEMEIGVEANLPLSTVVERETEGRLTILTMSSPTEALRTSITNKSTSPFVRMGSILYPLPVYHGYVMSSADKVLFLNVDIGEVEPSTSRETLVLQAEELDTLRNLFEETLADYGERKANEIHNSDLSFREKFDFFTDPNNTFLFSKTSIPTCYKVGSSDFKKLVAKQFNDSNFKILKKERGKSFSATSLDENVDALASLFAYRTKLLYGVVESLDNIPRGLYSRVLEAGHNPQTQHLTAIVVESEDEIEKLRGLLSPQTTFHRFETSPPKRQSGPKRIKTLVNVHLREVNPDDLPENIDEIYWVPKNASSWNTFYDKKLSDNLSQRLVLQVCEFLDIDAEHVLACSKTDARAGKLLPERNIFEVLRATPLEERLDFVANLIEEESCRADSSKFLEELNCGNTLTDYHYPKPMRLLAIRLFKEQLASGETK